MRQIAVISIHIFLLSQLFLGLSSCQEEIDPIIEIGAEGVQSDDPLAMAIAAISSLDGSEDNIIDQSSCTTVKFPVQGIFEDQVITFASLSDVEAIGAGALEVEWLYPIEVVLSNHTAVVLPDEDAQDDFYWV